MRHARRKRRPRRIRGGSPKSVSPGPPRPKSHSQGKESWQGVPHAVEGWPIQGSSSRPWLPGPGLLPVPADASLAPALVHC
ncbi:hypothetical protein RRG08_043452 [Elysia crispata]|uniref:Uncharacterized protein n=1 Tax=Elysia crispata TaxID=231223 RepID=A0AAE1B344_9GAST|nr:hypothetical protein RRG08_043452 [Elysia crispata]